MNKILNYKDLIVWQKVMDLVILVNKITETFPKSELYGLVSQMRRSAVSIVSNIAEGSRRGTRKDFRNFLLNAFGSGAELETQIEISKRLSFISISSYQDIDQLLIEVMKILNVFIKKLK